MRKRVGDIRRRDTRIGVFVEDAVQEYMYSTHVKQLSVGTQKEYHDELKVFALWCASHKITQKNKKWIAIEDSQQAIMLHEINDQVVHLFLEHLKETHTPHKPGATELSTYTLSGYARVIKAFMNWCLQDDQYAHDVHADTIARIKKPQIIETILETFTPDQIEDLFKACMQEESEHLEMRDRAILAMLLDTGIRAHELVTLTIGHTTLDASDLHVRVLGKGQKWGEVGFGEQARRYVQKYVRMYREPTIEHIIKKQHKNASDRQLSQLIKQEKQHAPLFVNRYGKALTAHGLYQIFGRLGKWADIQGVRCSPHTCRHTFSVMFIRNGGDIYTLSKLLRHSSVATTEKYLKSLQQSEARRRGKSLLDNL